VWSLVPTSLIVAGYAASALYVHFRGRERLGLMRQIADHSTIFAPFNTFLYLRSAVPNRPMLDVDAFPELAPLREHWQTIRDEALALYRDGHIRKPSRHDDLAFNSFYKRDWQRFYLKWYGAPLPSARLLCPHTLALLERTPSVHAAMFALLAPHSHLVRHRDPFAGSLRLHLGLVTPNSEACAISVDGVPYHWHDGEAVLFDETYVHRAQNRTDRPRIILFCDVERPLRDRLATAANRWVIAHLMGATATGNVDGDPVGVANRVFEQVYRVRLAMKALKKRRRGLYYAISYTTKLVALLGLAYLLLFW